MSRRLQPNPNHPRRHLVETVGRARNRGCFIFPSSFSGAQISVTYEGQFLISHAGAAAFVLGWWWWWGGGIIKCRSRGGGGHGEVTDGGCQVPRSPITLQEPKFKGGAVDHPGGRRGTRGRGEESRSFIKCRCLRLHSINSTLTTPQN